MNRRDFVTGLGSLAASGVAVQALRDNVAAKDVGGFAANANPVGIVQSNQAAASAGMTLGYLPRSAAFISTWSPSSGEATIRERWGRSNVRAAVQILGFVRSAAPTIERIDITVNFALNEAPFFAPFYAWQYVDLPGQHMKSSSPLTFTASVPQAAGIAAAFRLKSAVSGAQPSGSLYYQIGGSGLGPGIYGLAGPSASTGLTPDWNQITWGEKAGSLARNDGMPIDFDYVTLVVSPVHAAG